MLKKRLGYQSSKSVSNNLKSRELVSWEPTHLIPISNNHFQWDKKYINVFTYSIKPRKYRRSKYIGKYNPGSLKGSVNIKTLPYELRSLEGASSRISEITQLRLIKINSPISNTKILTKILNKKKFGIIKSIERVNELANFHPDEQNSLKLGRLSNSLNRSDLNWYHLINIKRINTSMTGIKLEIHGRLTKRKKASRTKKYRYLKGKLCLNSFSSLIDKSRTVTSLVNGSVGIKMMTRSVTIFRTT